MQRNDVPKYQELPNSHRELPYASRYNFHVWQNCDFVALCSAMVWLVQSQTFGSPPDRWIKSGARIFGGWFLLFRCETRIKGSLSEPASPMMTLFQFLGSVM